MACGVGQLQPPQEGSCRSAGPDTPGRPMSGRRAAPAGAGRCHGGRDRGGQRSPCRLDRESGRVQGPYRHGWRRSNAGCMGMRFPRRRAAPAGPVVTALTPPTAARPHPVDLLLCAHHCRVSRAALAGAVVTGGDSRALPRQRPRNRSRACRAATMKRRRAAASGTVGQLRYRQLVDLARTAGRKS